MQSRLRRFFEVSQQSPAFGQGLRGAIVWAIFLFVGFRTDQVALGIQAGFVGWIIAFCDDAVGTGRRFAGAFILTLVAGVATFVATLGGNSIVGSVIVTAALGTAACLASVGGPAGTKKGLVTMFLALFAIGQGGDVTTATQMMIASFIGGLATMGAMAIGLPFQRSRNPLSPAAAYFSQCARLLRMYESSASEVEISQERIRLVDSRQEAMLDARYSGTGTTQSELFDYLERCSDLIMATVTFHDTRHSSKVPLTSDVANMYGAVAHLCEQASHALKYPGLHDVGIQSTLSAIDKVITDLRAEPASKQLGVAALHNLRSTVDSMLGESDGNAAPQLRTTFGPSVLDRLFASLRYDTPLRRHTARYIILMTLATAMYKWLEIPDGFFITIGINIMLQPDLGTSVSRLRAYALGTIAGSVLGAILGTTLDSYPIGLTVATAITVFVMIAYTRVTWWAFAVGASVFIVSALGLLVEGGFYLGMWRILDTLIAAVFVSIGTFLLWPRRATKLAPSLIADGLRAVSRNLQTAVNGDLTTAAECRREAVRAATNLSQRIAEYAREPGHSPETLAQLRTSLIDIQRMYGLATEISRLEIQDNSEDAESHAELGPTRDSVVATLNLTANAFETNQKAENLPEIVPVPPTSSQLLVGSELVTIGLITKTLGSHSPLVHVSQTRNHGV